MNGSREAWLTAWAAALIAAAGAFVFILFGEQPRGHLSAVVSAEELGRPLPEASVNLIPLDGGARARGRADSNGRVMFRRIPTGRYRITAQSRAHKQRGRTVEVREGKVTSVNLELSPVEPFLEVYAEQNVFTPAERPELRTRGFGPAASLELELYRMDEATTEAARRGSLAWAVITGGGSAAAGDEVPSPREYARRQHELEGYDLRAAPGLELISARRRRIRSRDVEGVFNEWARFSAQPPGFYLVAISLEDLRRLQVIAVTDLSIITKQSDRRLLVYATDIDSGEPRPGVDVTADWDDESIGGGETDADGLLLLDLPQEAGSGQLEVVARDGESFAVVSNWHWYSPDHGGWRAYTYTDRPAYRPGQKVYFKSVTRQIAGREYALPEQATADVEVRDERDNLLYAQEHEINSFGSLAGEFELPENALPGRYTMAVELDGEPLHSSFDVLEYRKPEYEVKVKTDRERYVRGDEISARVSAEYYYGAPVPNAQVRYEVRRQQYWFYPGRSAYDEDLYEPYGYSHDGEVILEGTGTTDDAGELGISIPTIVKPEEGEEGEQQRNRDYRYTIYVDVTDPSRRSVSGSTSVVVTAGEFDLKVKCTPTILGPDGRVSIAIEARDYEGNPVDWASGSVALLRTRYADGVESRVRQASTRWEADEQGKAQVTLAPRQMGNYHVEAVAEDRRGNRIVADDWLWVTEGRYASFSYPYGELELETDKEMYEAGEVAKILANTDHAPATALVTIEGSRIYEHWLLRLPAKSTIIQVKAREEYMPGCEVSVCFVKEKKLYSEQCALRISRQQRALNVSIESDKKEYRPGEAARYEITTTDASGEPVSAELSLAVTDESVHAVAPDRSGDILKYFYPRDYSRVRTDFSFPRIYLSGGDKAGAEIETREYFPDTAYWAPDVVTGADGTAAAELEMPDSLTTWRATARAQTRDDHFGQMVSKVICSKPLLVRLEAPRFFTQEDTVTVGNIVHNRTSEAVQVTAGVEAAGLSISGESMREARVGAGDIHSFEWQVAARSVGDQPIRVWAKGGQLSDAMRLSVPVLPKGRRRVETRCGVAKAVGEELLAIREDAIAGATSMQIRLTPSLASGMLGALDYLASYPYGCTEQTMSAFLPDVIIARMLEETGLEAGDLQEKLPAMVREGLLRLYDKQHPDGGWGWWNYDESHPWMTAYVVFGLTEARNAGFTVNPQIYDSGLRALVRLIEDERVTTDQRAFGGYVLSLTEKRGEASKAIGPLLESEGGVRGRLSNWGRAALMLALANLGKEREMQLAAAALRKEAQRAEGIMHWEGRDKWSDTETTAFALKALCRLDGGEAGLGDIVRWLMLHRRGGRWYSTRDTAFILYALSDYLQLTGELHVDLAVVVEVNGRQLVDRTFTRADVAKPEMVVDVPQGLLTGSQADVTLRSEGEGRLYYSMELSQYIPIEAGAELVTGKGLRVARTFRKLDGGDSAEVGQGLLTVQTGDIIEVTLDVSADEEFDYLMVEDPIPAGCEVPDQGRIPMWQWDHWWADRVVRDEKVAFAITHLRSGDRTLKYKLVAQIPGRYGVMPTQIYNMYQPTIRTFGQMAQWQVRD